MSVILVRVNNYIIVRPPPPPAPLYASTTLGCQNVRRHRTGEFNFNYVEYLHISNTLRPRTVLRPAA